MALADAQRRLADNKAGLRGALLHAMPPAARQAEAAGAAPATPDTFVPASPVTSPPAAAVYTPTLPRRIMASTGRTGFA